jgi:hypothetical protein
MPIEIRPVTSRRELNTFIKLPWRLYRDEPNWVAPLLTDVKKRLDRSLHVTGRNKVHPAIWEAAETSASRNCSRR